MPPTTAVATQWANLASSSMLPRGYFAYHIVPFATIVPRHRHNTACRSPPQFATRRSTKPLGWLFSGMSRPGSARKASCSSRGSSDSEKIVGPRKSVDESFVLKKYQPMQTPADGEEKEEEGAGLMRMTLPRITSFDQGGSPGSSREFESGRSSTGGIAATNFGGKKAGVRQPKGLFRAASMPGAQQLWGSSRSSRASKAVATTAYTTDTADLS